MIDLYEPSSAPRLPTVDQLGIRTVTVNVRACVCLLMFMSTVPRCDLSGVLRLSREQRVRVRVAVLFLCVTDFSVCACEKSIWKQFAFVNMSIILIVIIMG